MSISKPIFESARERFLLYRTSKFTDISTEVIESIDWPAALGSLVFSLEDTRCDDFETLSFSLGGKYLGRFLYTAEKKELVVLNPRDCRDIGEYHFKDSKELQDLYLHTEMEYFGKKWRESLPWETYTEAIMHNARERLSSARIFCLERNGIPVALLPLTRIKHFLDERETDWVLWIWIEESLTPEERAVVHSKLMCWLRNQVQDRVMTGVHVFNARSNKFFQKIGFRRKWLQVTRLKK